MTAVSSGIVYVSDVCVTVDKADGSSEVVEGCNGDNPNLFSAAGQDAVMDLVTNDGATLAAFDWITLCVTGVDATQCISEYGDSGLSPAAGTFNKVDIGNWSISNTFTATDDGNNVAGTSLKNASSGTYFAGNNFTQVTLNTNDQITIRWNISIS